MLFLDFDGTMSRVDVVDVLLERFALPAWTALESDWREGRIGSRECLAGQIDCMRAGTEAVDTAIAGIGLDVGLVPLLDAAARHRMPVYVLSDGFDYCIDRLLATLPPRVGQPLRASVRASRLEPAPNGLWRAAFPFYADPCAHGCATCKPRLMEELSGAGQTRIFVGDGLSDRHAARAADVVFAKASLAAFCEREAIPFVPYGGLADVAERIERDIVSGRVWPTRVARLEA